ncbi:hypothetical protein CMV_019100 [Castanea mollissima]|uniref:Uncharacterized protein n=1 Tax=Castanea mollissima TaxID=60419 RepID=A0A8J4VN40_9ROSI|nr:hypothetical protein CMV_019100 [Castanea mollissima]
MNYVKKEKINVHAHTEGKLQVELAALMYMETRLACEHGPDGCYTFGAVGEAEIVNAQGAMWFAYACCIKGDL